MIRNIIFDVGKVLVSYEPDAYMQRLGISKENQKKINEAMFQNKLWDTSDQGLGTPDEFLQKFIAGAPELADEITKIHKTVGNTVELFPYAMEWILDLKARGYHVYILSNYSENMLDQTKDKLKFLPLMDGVVFSYKIKKMKPDPEIYEYLCDEYWPDGYGISTSSGCGGSTTARCRIRRTRRWATARRRAGRPG